MFTPNSRLIIISEDVPFTQKGEEITIRAQSNSHLLCEDQDGNCFKVDKLGLGTQFMISFLYSPDLGEDVEMDLDGQTYTLNLEDYK